VFHYKNKKRYSGPYNVGPSQKKLVNVLSLTKKFISIIGANFKISFKKKNKFTESKLLVLSSKKIFNHLKWSPSYSFKKSILKTALWYKNYLDKKNIKKFTETQIENYFIGQ
tara:strand:+ start:346 stop:681 length:336 start_codon:yes stop_codon:yes gene_type:complete